MNRRLVIVLLFALVIAGAASALLYRVISSQLAANRTTTTQVVIAARNLASGDLIKEGDVRMADFAGTPPVGTLVSVDKAIDRGVVYPIFQGEAVVDMRLAAPGAGAAEVARSASPSLDSVKLVDAILQKLNLGNIAFNAPSMMTYKQPKLVELLVSPSLSLKAIQEQLEKEVTGDSQPAQNVRADSHHPQKVGAESARVHISNRMEAQLTGSGFTIEATTPSLQAITSEEPSLWKWEIVPTEYGKQRLHLTLSAHIDVANRDTPLVVRTFDRMIEVQITVPQRVSGFVQGNWQWLWAVVLTPIVGYLWKRWKIRRA